MYCIARFAFHAFVVAGAAAVQGRVGLYLETLTCDGGPCTTGTAAGTAASRVASWSAWGRGRVPGSTNSTTDPAPASTAPTTNAPVDQFQALLALQNNETVFVDALLLSLLGNLQNTSQAIASVVR